MLTEKEKMETLSRLVIQLNRVSSIDILMEHILTQAGALSNAGCNVDFTYRRRILQFAYTQNDTLQKRLSKGEKLIYSTFSLPINEQSIAGYVAATGKPLNIAHVTKSKRQAHPTSAKNSMRRLATPRAAR